MIISIKFCITQVRSFAGTYIASCMYIALTEV